MVIPCKECISYAICISKELVICDLLWHDLEECSIQSYQEKLWTAMCEVLPNMDRVRWENNPYNLKSRNLYEQSVYQRGKDETDPM